MGQMNHTCSKSRVIKYAFIFLLVLLSTHITIDIKALRNILPQRIKLGIDVTKDLTFVLENKTNKYRCLTEECSDVNLTMKADYSRMCGEVSNQLEGELKILIDSPSYSDLERLYPWVDDGGRGKPANCISHHRVAIIIPYRNRDSQLRTFLYNIHPFLYRQELDYGIYVVEQYGNTSFNRAMLMNIGYTEAKKMYGYQCFIFHDVDLLPENDNNMYSCPIQPRHLSAFIDKFKYRLPYNNIFGGVTALTDEQFQQVNGYSNKYFGWGGEDDDLWNRIKAAGYKVIRNSVKIAKYKMIKHGRDIGNKPNPQSNIPAAPADGLYISQLIGYSRACDDNNDFCVRIKLLTFK